LQAAQERSEALNDELDTARTEFTERQRILEQRILQAYMYPRSDTLSAVLAADDLTEAERRRVLADNVAADDRRILAERQAAATELARLEVEVRATADSIEARLAQQESDLDALRVARARADEVAAALDDRIGSFQAEAEGLAASEADLVAIIARRQAAAITTTTTTAPAVTTPPDPDDPTPPTSPPTTAPPVPGGALVWPTQGVLTSPYGWRWGTMHRGIDIGAPSGTPIYAAAGGTVFYAGWMGGYGNLILIDHGDGRVTAYAHQSSLAVSGGQVGRGQIIGYVGSTGDSTGPHLHFELRVDGTAVDPLPYL
jgi:murein DD-endopeptidase MepM/ murein hydrolase activator NlpD